MDIHIYILSNAESHTYELRAYLYQARDMYGSDRSGLSDPYAIISLSRFSSHSRVVKAEVCPAWDETVIISNIKIFGDVDSVKECPPPVVLEFFDEDQVVCYFISLVYFLRLWGNYVVIYDENYDIIYEVIMRKFRGSTEPFWDLKIHRDIDMTCIYNIISSE